MDNLTRKINSDSPNPWEEITLSTISEHGGSMLLKKHKILSNLLTSVFPGYKQACKDLVMSVVADQKLAKVEDILHVNMKYHIYNNLAYQASYIKNRAPIVMQQHNNSIHACM